MKSKIVAIRLAEEELEAIRTKALHANLTVTDYIHEALFPRSSYLLTIERILNRIEELKESGKLSSGDVIKIRDIFSRDEYLRYPNVITVGRAFASMAQNPDSEVYAAVQLVPHTKPAQYIIK